MCGDPELEKAVLKELQEHGRKSKLEKFELPGKCLSELNFILTCSFSIPYYITFQVKSNKLCNLMVFSLKS